MLDFSFSFPSSTGTYSFVTPLHLSSDWIGFGNHPSGSTTSLYFLLFFPGAAVKGTFAIKISNTGRRTLDMGDLQKYSTKCDLGSLLLY